MSDEWEELAPDPILLTSIPKPSMPWKRLGLDLAGPYSTTPHCQQFITSVADYHSEYPEVLLTTDVHSLTIIRWLKELFLHYGCQDEIAMDNRPQFVSTEFQLFLEERGVKPPMSFIFNPHESGLIVHWNKMLKYGVQAFCVSDWLWEDGVQELLSQHRHMPATAQGLSPATLLFQRPTCLAF